jgi:BlaI family transcriptional regulator, penicillinase repressor
VRPQGRIATHTRRSRAKHLTAPLRTVPPYAVVERCNPLQQHNLGAMDAAEERKPLTLRRHGVLCLIVDKAGGSPPANIEVKETMRKSMDDLGDLQRAVMETIWEMGEATVNQIREKLNRDKDLAYTTVLSVMQKLEKAGWLGHREEGRTYVYRPKQTRKQEGTRSLKAFVKSVFGGDPVLMFQHLLDDERIGEEEIEALERMIEERKERAEK